MATQGELLHSVGVRIVAAHLTASGCTDVRTSLEGGIAGSGVDIAYLRDGSSRTAKVKADPYFGTDAALIADHSLPFYRADSRLYALETIADARTRAPGWAFSSDADELLYLFVALASKEPDVVSALKAPDDECFAGLDVERDELHVLPMTPLRAWLESSQERYPSRPVTAGASACWVRLVPTADVARSSVGARVLGSVFPRAR